MQMLQMNNYYYYVKGIYPLDYLTSYVVFEEKQLPTKEQFYSKLSEHDISDEDYEHATKIWKVFNCQTFGDYHDLYQKTDVLLLADIFENFRNMCIDYNKLDPCNYLTAPGLSMDAALRMTKIKLDLITNIDMYNMVDNNIRGGMSIITNRYAKANNKYMKFYDDSKDSNYIIYLDANNLYGWAMSQYLPVKNF